MVQKEINKKTKLYTLAAIMSAIILASSIYAVTMPTAMYGLTPISPMKTFNSIDELKNYLTVNTQQSTSVYPTSDDSGSYWVRPDGNPSATPTPVPSSAPITLGGEVSVSGRGFIGFSQTNVQVAGVDEADVVKTDGTYIYTLTNSYSKAVPLGGVSPSFTLPSRGIQIVRADPQNPAVVGKIAVDDSMNIAGMYLSENGDKLAVLGSSYTFIPYLARIDGSSSDSAAYYFNSGHSYLYVYDVSNKANPVLTRNMTLSGNYLNSRMIGDYIYMVVNQPTYVDDEIVILPRFDIDNITQDVDPTRIYYTNIQDTSFSYTTFAGLNIMDNTEQPETMTILMSASSCMYVSTDNMYLTFTQYSENNETTELYRVAINGANLAFMAQGVVPGHVLNQYSMDEYNSYFRIATTYATGFWPNRSEHNNLYVLNMNLEVTGKIENIAPGERIYSARFTGDKAYLVTFEQIDPFFVIDLQNPNAPKIAGELKIPGLSNYLHPYNENYIIGVGQEDNKVKLSLFDVTNMNNPIEVAKYIISENVNYAHTPVQYEPKAFLFSPQNQLIVLPITTTLYYDVLYVPQNTDDSTTDSTTPQPTMEPQPDTIPKPTPKTITEVYNWQGAYALNVSPENGFTLQKTITHQPTNTNTDWYTDYSISRALYINNTLYTVSNEMIQLHSLDNFGLIAKVPF